MQVFDIRAHDGSVTDAGCHHARYEVGERGNSVHEDPETGELGWSCKDTVLESVRMLLSGR
jgi:hypothetical protein